jgi:glycosyltransferase involved in cell wall biosynthesis
MRPVTILVVSYNSGQFITETLESIYNQTWKEIELIVTDDCSNDDTVSICSRWLKENGHRFFSYYLLTSPENTGVTANASRGLRAATGEWVKLLGADDTLKPTCVEDNMVWIASHPETQVLFSRVEVFQNVIKKENSIKIIPKDPYNRKSILYPDRNANSQYRMLLVCDRIHFSPSVFLNREILISSGGFDERFRMLEDYPLWLNLTRSGCKLFFMNKVTVNYRQHSMALNNKGDSWVVNPNYFLHESFRKLYTYPNLPLDVRLSHRFVWVASQLFRLRLLNRYNKFNKSLYGFLTSYLNPFKYYITIRTFINKGLRENEFYT